MKKTIILFLFLSSCSSIGRKDEQFYQMATQMFGQDKKENQTFNMFFNK